MAFCGYCGKEISDGQTFCKDCNNMLAKPETHTPAQKKQKRNPLSIIYFIAAGLTFILCLFGGIQILNGAEDLLNFSNNSSKTVLEGFYHSLGTVFGGFGLFVIAFGVFIGAFLAYCGSKSKQK